MEYHEKVWNTIKKEYIKFAQDNCKLSNASLCIFKFSTSTKVIYLTCDHNITNWLHLLSDTPKNMEILKSDPTRYFFVCVSTPSFNSSLATISSIKKFEYDTLQEQDV